MIPMLAEEATKRQLAVLKKGDIPSLPIGGNEDNGGRAAVVAVRMHIGTFKPQRLRH